MQVAIQFGNQRPPNYKRLKIKQMKFGGQRPPKSCPPDSPVRCKWQPA